MIENAMKKRELEAQLAGHELELFLMEQKVAACDSVKASEDSSEAEKLAHRTLEGERIGYQARAIYLQAFVTQYTKTIESL